MLGHEHNYVCTGKPSALLTTNQLTLNVPITEDLCKNYNQKTDWVLKKCFILNLVAGTIVVNCKLFQLFCSWQSPLSSNSVRILTENSGTLEDYRFKARGQNELRSF